MKKEYTALSIPASTVADLNRLKIAFGYHTGRIYTNEEVIAELISSLEKANPAVYGIYRNINGAESKIL